MTDIAALIAQSFQQAAFVNIAARQRSDIAGNGKGGRAQQGHVTACSAAKTRSTRRSSMATAAWQSTESSATATTEAQSMS